MLIQTSNIEEALALWLDENGYSQLFVLVDENTKESCLPLLSFEKTPILIEIKSGEEHKNISTCQYIWQKLLLHKADRKALLINLGGGVICDMGGFCASTYKRGIDFINIPTTLLAQVDASIGAKTGIDFHGQKNMVGLFVEAKVVFLDTIFLKTLAKRQVLSGFAEVLKHGLIANEKYFNDAINIYKRQEIDWSKLVSKSIEIKSEIVRQDPKEKGLRKILNFGHTIGHAFESYSLKNHQHNLLHGEAVILGMLGDLYLSVQKGFITQKTLNEISDKLLSIYSFKHLEKFNSSELIQYMINDKKNSEGVIQSILLESIGKASYGYTFNPSEIESALIYIEKMIKHD